MSYANDPRYALVATNQPCPLKGRDNCLVETTWQGRPAWWEDGNIFAIRPEALEAGRKTNTWVQNLDKYLKGGKG